MTWLILFLVLLPLLMTLPTVILIKTFKPVLLRLEEVEAGGPPLTLAEKALGLVAYLSDVLANYTLLALLFGSRPKWGEWTFSLHLPRLVKLPGLRGFLALAIKAHINSEVPGHIPD